MTGDVRGGCPVAHGRSEPAASGSARPASSGAAAAAAHPFQQRQQHFPGLLPEGEEVPENAIPAAGRGNSDDGKSWLNPSANQLFRALMRKDKPIEASDASSVAAVHVAVTDNTWQCILEYEKLHAKSCPQGPTLSRFQGMDGIYSFKAQIMMRLWGMRPFDRHDWYVNRCGKEVKYVIDYYSYETPTGPAGSGETAIDYFIDARPAPTVAGLWDRSRVAFQKWRRGEKIF